MWIMCVFCIGVSVLVVVSKNPNPEMIFNEALEFGILFAVPIIAALACLYFAVFCGKIVVDFDKKEFSFYKFIGFEEKIPFRIVTKIILDSWNYRGEAQPVLYFCTEAKEIKCAGYRTLLAHVVDLEQKSKLIVKRLYEIIAMCSENANQTNT